MNTLQEYLAAFLEEGRLLGRSARTLQEKRYYLRAFLAWLLHTYQIETASLLRPTHLHAYQKHLCTRMCKTGLPAKPGSINTHINAVRGLLGYLYKHGHLLKDLSNHLVYVKEPQLLPTSVLEDHQVRKLIDSIDCSTALGYRNRTIIELLYSCGLRNMELCGLDLSDVDLENRTLLVNGKGQKQRVTPIGRTACYYLTSYLQAIRPYWPKVTGQSALFLTRFGKPLGRQVLGLMLREICADLDLGVHVTPHTFRRSCTTELIRSNANLYHVKLLLGHESLDTLTPYTKLTIVDLKRTHAACHPRECDQPER